jgi:hypothetical protein
MAQPTDTSAIRQLVGRARLRIRAQWAFEGAATATVLAAAAGLAAVFAMRAEWISTETGVVLAIGAFLIVIAGAAIRASRRLDDEAIARRIDRASGLADRLSTAIAFDRALAAGAPADHETTYELMHAAIRDGVRSAPNADVKAAAPFSAPKDLRAALGFVAIAALAAGLRVPVQHDDPRVGAAHPAFGPPGVTVAIDAAHLSPIPGNVFLGALERSRPIVVLDWSPTEIKTKIPDDAAIGDTKLLVFAGDHRIGEVEFKVVDKKDKAYHPEDSVALDPDEKAYVEAILAELKNVAQRDQVPELDEFAKKLQDLLGKAENGEITKEQLLDALAKAEEALDKDAEPNQAEVAKKLGEMGKQLKQDPMTKDLGDALEKQDLQRAKQELERLAEKLDSKQLSEKDKQQLAKKLDQVAKQMDKQDQQDQKKSDAQQQKLQEQIRKLENQQKEAKTDQQRQDLERRLEDKRRELAKLEKEQQQKEQSDQRRAVKRLQKDLEKAAENLEKPQKDQNGSQQDQQDSEREASQKLKDAARETGRVDRDQRKQATQKKMSSQMDDLREAMRRAKQKGSKGPQDPFNRQGKNQDFIARARGQKSGQGQSWKPGQSQGQGQGSGQGSGQQGGSGQQQGGDTWGVGHDDNLEGDSTAMTGNTKDADVQGQQGKDGGSTRETILAAARKGFASQGYRKVYADYQRIVEEVMRTEKLPSSYKYYVKRYFAKIHPSMTAEDAPKGSK